MGWIEGRSEQETPLPPLIQEPLFFFFFFDGGLTGGVFTTHARIVYRPNSCKPARSARDPNLDWGPMINHNGVRDVGEGVYITPFAAELSSSGLFSSQV